MPAIDAVAIIWSAARNDPKTFHRISCGFEPDPDYPTYPFHPEARNAMIAVCEIGAEGVRKAGFIPCWVNPEGQPEVCGDDERSRAVASYVEQITRKAGLRTSFEWDEGCVRCC